MALPKIPAGKGAKNSLTQQGGEETQKKERDQTKKQEEKQVPKQDQSTQGGQDTQSQSQNTVKKIGILAAIFLFLGAVFYDIADIILTLIADDYWILDILYLPVTFFWWGYCWYKGLTRSGLIWLGYIIEWLPVVDVLNLQIIYALILIITNRSTKLSKMVRKMPAPSKAVPEMKAA